MPFSANPQPVIVPMKYYRYNDPTCSIPEGHLPGPRSDTLLREWIEYQKVVKAKEEEACQTVQVKVVEVAKLRQEEEDVCAMKRLEEDARVVKAGEAKAVDWSLPP
ncbi:hypothetical protein BDZ89DRAFT_1150850 [Hymenopellis radicata]|nr:hypothetical protein BDZ89DRAFT_1150850 [Hymenopellis radicata]